MSNRSTFDIHWEVYRPVVGGVLVRATDLSDGLVIEFVAKTEREARRVVLERLINAPDKVLEE